jgi:hypothetical protein
MQAFVFGDTPGRGRAKIIANKNNDAPVNHPDNNYSPDKRFVQFWDLMDTIQVHGYLRAAMSVIGRTSIGTWWDLVKHSEFKNVARELHKKKLYKFYMMFKKDWDNIKDFYSIAYKVMIGVMYLRYFGQCAYHIVRDGTGNPIGLDFLHGFVRPNVESSGKFKNPAFIQYPTRDKKSQVEYDDPKDIVYIVNPDFEGYVTGGSDVQSLTDYALPIDIYLQTAAREYIRNRNKPEAFYVLDPNISDDAFNDFCEALEDHYSGPGNLGKNPVAVAGELNIKELSRLPSDLPYQEARDSTREETLAVSGVAGAKIGISSEESNANIRELRREFHESSMIPLFRFIEIAFYEQIHIREFGFYGWEFKFKSPDFLTAVERATVDMRYWSIGAVNPNEVRHDSLSKEPRTDENGDLYVDQLEEMNSPSPLSNPDTGTSPGGREDDPDAPANTGEPTDDDQDPPRGDQHDEEILNFIEEVKKFRSFIFNRLKRGRNIRTFQSKIIPKYILDQLNYRFRSIETFEDADRLFDEIFEPIRELGYYV